MLPSCVWRTVWSVVNVPASTSIPTFLYASRKGTPSITRRFTSSTLKSSEYFGSSRICSLIFISRIIRVTMRRQSFNSSNEGRKSSLMICRSRKYPEGRLLQMSAICWGIPWSVLHLARVSSNTSGFFLWGMMLEPVVNESGNWMNPKFWLLKRQASIANFERVAAIPAMA